MYEQCHVCENYIQHETTLLDQEDCYEIDGVILCGDCVESYVRKHYYKKLEFEDVPNDYGTHKECYPNRED